MLKVIVLLACCLICRVIAQNYIKQFVTSSTDNAQSIIEINLYLYISGHSNGAFPGNTYAGGYDIFIGKFDRDANSVYI